MRRQLIPQWKRCWRMFSVQAMVLAGALQAAWAALPPEMMETIPEPWVRGITITLLVLGVIGRLVVQPTVSGEGDD